MRSCARPTRWDCRTTTGIVSGRCLASGRPAGRAAAVGAASLAR
jgi:hypothetical protein